MNNSAVVSWRVAGESQLIDSLKKWQFGMFTLTDHSYVTFFSPG